MIWHTEELTCPEQPDEATLSFIGIFNSPGSNLPMITLRLAIETKPGDAIIVKTLMEKNPSFLSFEEPSPDQIKEKYYSQVLKARDKIMKTPYKNILGW